MLEPVAEASESETLDDSLTDQREVPLISSELHQHEEVNSVSVEAETPGTATASAGWVKRLVAVQKNWAHFLFGI